MKGWSKLAIKSEIGISLSNTCATAMSFIDDSLTKPPSCSTKINVLNCAKISPPTLESTQNTLVQTSNYRHNLTN